MVRLPIVAGMFYEADKDKLLQQIKESFLSRFGPGEMPRKILDKRIIGSISPHAGYAYSGACASFGFKNIAESEKPDLFILLGLSHQGYTSCVSLEDWQTPLGLAKNDREFTKSLIKNTNLTDDEEAHSREHSIEVQIPFLQYLYEDIRIVPVIVSQDRDCKELAKSIVKTIKDSGKNVCIIASSDFTHYGVNYGFIPFRDNISENLKKLDMQAMRFIQNLDSEGFLGFIRETGATICGMYPISVLIECSILLRAKNPRILEYYNSGEISGNYSSVVGYASIIIEKE